VNTTEITVSNGAVLRCRPVPPYAITDVLFELEEPEYPFIDVRSGDTGGSERLPALRDTPEWIEYQKSLRRFRKRQNSLALEADLNIGIVSWKMPGSDQFEQMPPAGWKVPAIMTAYGVESATEETKRRVQFIKYELIMTQDDDDAVMGLIRKSKTISDKEIDAAAAPFESGESEPAA
jgi:hypothetical protein